MASPLFRNDACVVVNKLPGEDSESPGLVSRRGKFPVPVHRLDTPVSGCLLLAHTASSAAFLSAAFARVHSGVHEGGIEKRYWAIVEKPHEEIPPCAELRDFLVEDKRTNKVFALPPEDARLPETAPARRASSAGKNLSVPKEAVLRYKTLGQGDFYLFLEIALISGRHHQIRAQLAARGLHIKGDLKYGARRSEKAGGIRLHARSLAFPNPLEHGEIIRVAAPPPFEDALWLAFAEAARIEYTVP